MGKIKKERRKPPEPPFCLYHEAKGCECIHPVIDVTEAAKRRENAAKWAVEDKERMERVEARLREAGDK